MMRLLNLREFLAIILLMRLVMPARSDHYNSETVYFSDDDRNPFIGVVFPDLNYNIPNCVNLVPFDSFLDDLKQHSICSIRPPTTITNSTRELLCMTTDQGHPFSPTCPDSEGSKIFELAQYAVDGFFPPAASTVTCIQNILQHIVDDQAKCYKNAPIVRFIVGTLLFSLIGGALIAACVGCLWGSKIVNPTCIGNTVDKLYPNNSKCYGRFWSSCHRTNAAIANNGQYDALNADNPQDTEQNP